MKNWNGCKKEECRLFQPCNCNGCRLDLDSVRECYETGCYFHPRPQELTAEEYECVRPFSILDLASSGIAHQKINSLHKEVELSLNDDHRSLRCLFGIRGAPLSGWSFKIMEKANLIPDLETHGFTKRVEPEIKAGSWVMDRDGNIGHVSGTALGYAIYWLDGGSQWIGSAEELRLIPDPIFQKTE